VRQTRGKLKAQPRERQRRKDKDKKNILQEPGGTIERMNGSQDPNGSAENRQRRDKSRFFRISVARKRETALRLPRRVQQGAK